ncbi:MAG: rRNA maturation RNase YbeY [Clostridia bacterium]
MKKVDVHFLNIEENRNYSKQIAKIIKECFKQEKFLDKNLYVNVILTTPEDIRKFNKEYRNIDKETDVLSFPMFEKEELENMKLNHIEVLGDIVISIEQVKKQAIEYEHSFEREFAYMVVHGFCHIIGYDHIEEEDKKKMRQEEEKILGILKILD